MGVDKELGIYEGYREGISVKSLFAFLELQDGRRVNPVLLSDITEEYALSIFDVGLLQDLLSERAEPSKIAKELKIVTLVEWPEDVDSVERVSPEELVQAIVKEGDVSNESRIRFLAAGYTPEVIADVQRFITNERQTQTEARRHFLNQLSYTAARRGYGTFAQLRAEYASRSDSDDIAREINNNIMNAFRKRQQQADRFERDIYAVLNGPSYTFSDDIDAPKFRAGVEFGRDGLRIIIPDQDFRDIILTKTKEVFFNAKDIGVMREIAYGRSLAASSSNKRLAKE
jgi:hypothetical protein